MPTINISMPTEMYKQVKNKVSEGKYISVSEYIRDALRQMLYQKSVFQKEILNSPSKKI